jgi:CelD/BcsL family acetyltransferase involved in cellulose biosynthesis
MTIQTTLARTAEEMDEMRPLWEFLCASERTTIFQDFGWNRLAATTFAGREEPWVVCAQCSYGVAIVPAAVRPADGTVRFLGEELFDYRCFLHAGEDSVLAVALAELAALRRPLEAIALREQDLNRVTKCLSLYPFSAAPQVCPAESSPDEFAARHRRLARNLRRLERAGLAIQSYSGNNSQLLRFIYDNKAIQDSRSLFRDPLRVRCLMDAARLQPSAFEIFALESGSTMAAAVVTLRDQSVRRFYTGWFSPKFEKLSPAVTLIYEVTRRSLAEGLVCDYMTGEQPYKMRLATSCVPLFRLHASPQQLDAMASITMPSSISAA